MDAKLGAMGDRCKSFFGRHPVGDCDHSRHIPDQSELYDPEFNHKFIAVEFYFVGFWLVCSRELAGNWRLPGILRLGHFDIDNPGHFGPYILCEKVPEEKIMIEFKKQCAKG